MSRNCGIIAAIEETDTQPLDMGKDEGRVSFSKN
jgi:hypothetical protein